MYTCIAIDDEEHAISGLKEYITTLPGLKLIHAYTDALQALKEISAGQKVDIIFMDVDMPLISGIELSKAIRNKTDKLVFTTSHSKYAFEAFEVEADAFLLKPYTFAKFALTIYKLFPQQSISNDHFILENNDFFFVKNKEDNLKLVKVRFEDIIAIESLQNYVRIYTTNEKIVAYFSLTELKNKLLGRPEFVQIQRSFIISKKFIDKIDGNTIILNQDLKITIGDYYKESIQEFIKGKTLKTGQ